MVARFSANFSENWSEAVSGRLWGSRGKFKTMQAFFVQLSTGFGESLIPRLHEPALAARGRIRHLGIKLLPNPVVILS